LATLALLTRWPPWLTISDSDSTLMPSASQIARYIGTSA
jgi:hypothetical protein